MVKTNAPLHIRLTEPVVFLRGPSTGFDFRGRRQVVQQDGQPAMLRGLLTLRLSKPTRIRSISIKLVGKARTEWPEGIGPRRMDTFEEHVILSESTTFFSSDKHTDSCSRSAPRAASLGPGTYLDQWQLDEDAFDDDLEMIGVPDGDEGTGEWVGVNRRGRDSTVRSASALPASHDGNTWHRDGFSRRPSFSDDVDRLSPDIFPGRGPSPAYTPTAPPHEARRSSLRHTFSRRPSREPGTSPILASPESPETYDRDDSTETQRRLAMRNDVNAKPLGGSSRSTPRLGFSSLNESALDDRPGVSGGSTSARPILEVAGHRGSGEVRFAQSVRGGAGYDQHNDQASFPAVEVPSADRAASIRTTTSFSDSSTSLSTSSQEHSGGELHPVTSIVQPISTASTAYNSPVTSASPSIMAGISTDTLPRAPVPSSLAGPSSSRPSVSDRQDPDHRSQSTSGSFSFGQRKGKDRSGSVELEGQPSDDGRGRNPSKFSISAALRGLSKGRLSSKSRTRDDSRRSSTPEVPPPLPSGTMRSSSGSAIPQRLIDGERSGRAMRSDSLSQDGDFIAPYGRGGAGSQTRSTGRADSPIGIRDEKEESRSRGRNKGMKVLTGAFGIGPHQEDDGEDAHNWKEFRKGTYNYPISFPIPVDTPPTIHTEFGAVIYRLKATVVRVGALTLNLVEDVEVSMIASPQEDDLEESENVMVERQWEEQMRYQIALSGKAFPIGGTIPISIRLMPLMKIKVHRLMVSLEEKDDYYAQEKKIARHEMPKKFLMLFVKQVDRLDRIPLLPIISDDVNAARESPLAPLAKQAAVNNPTVDSFNVEGNDDTMYATLLDPMGPWHLEKNLAVPDCASTIRFSTKHEKTNITVSHFLKVTIRVERGDDEAVDARGRRKQFDIIIDTPIKILDCRVNPQWNSLPTYTANNTGPNSTAPSVCSVHGLKHTAPLLPAHRAFNQAVDPLITSSAPSIQGQSLSPVNVREASTSQSRDRHSIEHASSGQTETEDSLLERNIVYDRLMSGQVTETGEVPPTYGEAVASAIRSRSASGTGREGREESESRSRSRLRQSLVA